MSNTLKHINWERVHFVSMMWLLWVVIPATLNILFISGIARLMEL